MNKRRFKGFDYEAVNHPDLVRRAPERPVSAGEWGRWPPTSARTATGGSSLAARWPTVSAGRKGGGSRCQPRHADSNASWVLT